MYFLAVLTLDGYLLAPRRRQFSLSFDTYDTWCLLLPRSGSFSYELGELHGVARFGDVVVCPPGGTLWRRMRTPTSFFHARFRIAIGAVDERLRGTELDPPVGCSRLRDLDRLRADLKLLDTALSSVPGSDPAPSHSDLVAAHVVTDLVLMMLRDRDRSPEDPLVRKATTFILENFASPDLSLGELAAALGISAAQLSRRFRAARGITPVAYLRNVRLQKARELLAESDDTLQSVAEQCGYRSAFYLSRVFTAHTGHPPSTYRRLSRV